MRYITLNTDAQMPVIGLGTWQAAPGEVYQAIRWAIKLGYQMIDCAAIYGNEKEAGQAIHDAIAEGDTTRERLFIVSKLWNDSHNPENVLPAIKQTLTDLQLDYLDLYLVHWPIAQKKGTTVPEKDEDMISLKDLPLELTWAEMEKMHQQGLAKAIGVSNFSSKKLQSLIEKAEIVPAVNQIESHPFLVQKDLLDYCQKQMIAVMAYSPLGSQHKDSSEKRPIADEKIIEIAKKLNASPAQILLAWQMARGVAVIPKSVHLERLKENFASLAIELDEDDMNAISALNKDFRYISGKSFAYGDYSVESIWD